MTTPELLPKIKCPSCLGEKVHRDKLFQATKCYLCSGDGQIFDRRAPSPSTAALIVLARESIPFLRVVGWGVKSGGFDLANKIESALAAIEGKG